MTEVPHPATKLDPEVRRRWRLMLGPDAASIFDELDDRDTEIDEALEHLYGPRGRGAGTGAGGGTGAGTGGSGLMLTTEWINQVQNLFPHSVAEELIEDAVESFGLGEVIENPDVIDALPPSVSLLSTLLQTKRFLDDRVLSSARRIVERVVADLMNKLKQPVTQPFAGVRNRRRRSRLKVSANFDAAATIRANLRHRHPDTAEMIITEPLFASRTQPRAERWQVIVAVDQSGSMAASVIHSAVTAAIFAGLTEFQTKLIAFDTKVVDLSGQLHDPVELLMGVQLGGGTDIALALRYCRDLIDQPARTVMVLISDFEEGGSVAPMLKVIADMVGSGVRFLGLSALDTETTTFRPTSQMKAVARLGGHVAAMTPDALAQWVYDVVSGQAPPGSGGGT